MDKRSNNLPLHKQGVSMHEQNGSQASEDLVDRLRESRSVWTGVGKSGHAASLLAALAATAGLRAQFTHAEDLLHGELSGIGPDDVLISLSWSGLTDQISELTETANCTTVILTGSESRPRCNPTFVLRCPPATNKYLNEIPYESLLEQIRVGATLIAEATTGQERRESLRHGHPHGTLGKGTKNVPQEAADG